MRTLRYIIIFFMGLCASIAHADFLPDTTLQHEAITYFAAESRLLLEAQLNDTKGIVDARCYFKAGLDNNYLYVSMDHLSEETYQCSLPAFKKGSQTLEYFFLIVNGSSQVIRSTPYVAKEDGDGVVSQNQDTVDPSVVLYVRSELRDFSKDDTSIIDGQIDVAATNKFKQLYGLRAGVYELTDIPDSFNVMPGYFGGFIVDRIDNIIRPIEGFAPNLKQTFLQSESLKDLNVIEQNNTDEQLQPTDLPDIEGDNWSGYFTRTDSDIREYLTAIVTLTGSAVTITTTLTGLGHFLAGNMNSDGDMLLYDEYDDEDWTTHEGPATSTAINIYDYIWPPQLGAETPPLNVIVLYRPPEPPSGVQASDGLLADQIAVSWNPSNGATYYNVYTCKDNTTASCTSLSQVKTNQYLDTRKVAGLIFFRIKSCNEAGCGEFSDYDTGYSQLKSIPPLLHLLLKTN